MRSLQGRLDEEGREGERQQERISRSAIIGQFKSNTNGTLDLAMCSHFNESKIEYQGQDRKSP